jgi:hypothetical protein
MSRITYPAGNREELLSELPGHVDPVQETINHSIHRTRRLNETLQAAAMYADLQGNEHRKAAQRAIKKHRQVQALLDLGWTLPQVCAAAGPCDLPEDMIDLDEVDREGCWFAQYHRVDWIDPDLLDEYRAVSPA